MNDEQSAELVEELADAMWTGVLEDSTRMERYRLIGTSILPIIDRLLADRATTVAEPDAETVERVAKAIRASWQDVAAAWKEHRGHDPLWGELDGMDALQMAEAAIAAMPSCADAGWLDDALDSVRPHGADIGECTRLDGGTFEASVDVIGIEGGLTFHAVTVYGTGTTRREAILDAVRKAKGASGE